MIVTRTPQIELDNIPVMRNIKQIVAGLVILLGFSLLSCGCSSSTLRGSAPTATQSPVSPTGELHYKVPEGWITEHPTSNMRVAQYKLPKVQGDGEDAILVVYYFGAGQGGSVQANIERWTGQMVQADGSSSRDKAKSEALEVNGLKVTTLDLAGTYSAEMSPGSGALDTKKNYRLKAAVVETPKGPYFAKLVGPEKTVAHWDQAFLEYVKSFEFK